MTDLLNNLDKESKQENKELKVTKLKLEEIITNVHKYDNELVIAEFDNGLSVAYEKDNEDITYCLIPFDYSYEVHMLGNNIRSRKEKQFSIEAYLSIQRYINKNYKENDRLKNICREVGNQLNPKEKTERDWETIAVAAIGTLLSPITFPIGLYMLYDYWKTKPANNTVHSYLVGITIGAPLILISNLLFGEDTGVYEIKSKLCNDNKYPCVNFENADTGIIDMYFQNKHFEINLAYIHGEEELIDDYTNYMIEPNERKMPNSKNFIKIKENTLQELNELCEEKEREWAKWRFFAQELKTADHEQLLKKIGMI